MKNQLVTNIGRVLIALAILLSFSACAPQQKTVKIGIVAPATSMDPVIQGFKEGMAEKGYVDGKNITYLYSGPLGSDAAKLEAEVQSFVDARVDLILALATPGALAAKKVTTGLNIPVIFAPISDPVGIGLAASMVQPGGNMTGVRSGTFVGKELEWLNRIAPNAKKIFSPYNPKDNAAKFGLNLLNEAAKSLSLEIVAPEVTKAEDIPAVLASMPEDIDAIFMMTDSMILSRIADFVPVALKKKLPLTSINISQVEAGALMAYGPEFTSIGKQCARLVDQVLKGVNPGTLPVEDAEYYLYLNQKTADTIGIKFPDEVLRAAKTIVR